MLDDVIILLYIEEKKKALMNFDQAQQMCDFTLSTEGGEQGVL